MQILRFTWIWAHASSPAVNVTSGAPRGGDGDGRIPRRGDCLSVIPPLENPEIQLPRVSRL